MRTTTGFSFEPSLAPQALKNLVFLSVGLSLALPLIDGLSGMFFHLTGLQMLFSLMWNAFDQWYFWQPITYMFIQQSAGGIDLGLFISLFFRMYLVWVIGSTLIERFGTKTFFKLYIGTGILAALIFLATANLTGSYGLLVGNTPSLLAIFVMWALMNPDGMIYLFFIFPIRIKWILAGIVVFTFLSALSEGNPLTFVTTLTGILSGYLYSIMGWGLHTPFAFTYTFDRKMSHIGDRLYSLFDKKSYAKIFDIHSGKGRNEDEAFVDAMLDKISKSGRDSLTWWESYKLNKLSKRRK